jgi:hypothetical protein
MLDILNNLKPFFEDCYKEIGVREYSRIVKISPPTASKLLKDFETEGFLKKREERGFLLFRTNRENSVLRDFSRIYWRIKLANLINHLNSEFHNPTIILFGSLSKLEVSSSSDIDITILTRIKKNTNLDKYEKELGRKIQLFRFDSSAKINSKELKNNIFNGYLIEGVME